MIYSNIQFPFRHFAFIIFMLNDSVMAHRMIHTHEICNCINETKWLSTTNNDDANDMRTEWTTREKQEKTMFSASYWISYEWILLTRCQRVNPLLCICVCVWHTSSNTFSNNKLICFSCRFVVQMRNLNNDRRDAVEYRTCFISRTKSSVFMKTMLFDRLEFINVRQLFRLVVVHCGGAREQRST